MLDIEHQCLQTVLSGFRIKQVASLRLGGPLTEIFNCFVGQELVKSLRQASALLEEMQQAQSTGKTALETLKLRTNEQLLHGERLMNLPGWTQNVNVWRRIKFLLMSSTYTRIFTSISTLKHLLLPLLLPCFAAMSVHCFFNSAQTTGWSVMDSAGSFLLACLKLHEKRSALIKCKKRECFLGWPLVANM